MSAKEYTGDMQENSMYDACYKDQLLALLNSLQSVEEVDIQKAMLEAWNANAEREAQEAIEAHYAQLRSNAINKYFEQAKAEARLYDDAAGFHSPTLEEWGRLISEQLGH